MKRKNMIVGMFFMIAVLLFANPASAAAKADVYLQEGDEVIWKYNYQELDSSEAIVNNETKYLKLNITEITEETSNLTVDYKVYSATKEDYTENGTSSDWTEEIFKSGSAFIEEEVMNSTYNSYFNNLSADMSKIKDMGDDEQLNVLMGINGDLVPGSIWIWLVLLIYSSFPDISAEVQENSTEVSIAAGRLLTSSVKVKTCFLNTTSSKWNNISMEIDGTITYGEKSNVLWGASISNKYEISSWNSSTSVYDTVKTNEKHNYEVVYPSDIVDDFPMQIPGYSTMLVIVSVLLGLSFVVLRMRKKQLLH